MDIRCKETDSGELEIQKDFGSGLVGQVSNWKSKKIENIFVYIILLHFLASIRTSIAL